MESSRRLASRQFVTVAVDHRHRTSNPMGVLDSASISGTWGELTQAPELRDLRGLRRQINY